MKLGYRATGLPCEVVFKLNTGGESGDVGLQGGPVPKLHPEPHCVSNLRSKMSFLRQVYLVKWFSGQKVDYPQRT